MKKKEAKSKETSSHRENGQAVASGYNDVILTQRAGYVNVQLKDLPLIKITKPEILYGWLKTLRCEFTGLSCDEELLVWKKRTNKEVEQVIDFLKKHEVRGSRLNDVYYNKKLDFFEIIHYDYINGSWLGWWEGFPFEMAKRWMIGCES
jgi:hypothetical protein